MAVVLIIDDEPQMRRLLIRILSGAGHAAHDAANGADGIALFHKLRPALVITDIVMPDIDGIEMIRQLRQAAPAMPILAISGSGHPIYLRAATGLGANASIEKPFGADQLLSAVTKLLGEPGAAPEPPAS